MSGKTHVLVALPAAVLFLVAPGARDFLESSEARPASVARSMIESGDALLPRINGSVYLNKPPLYAWLVALSFRFFGGESEGAARVPAALLGILTVVMTAAFAARRLGREAGVLAGLVLALSLKFLLQARLAEIEILLAATVTAALIAFHRAGPEGGGFRWFAAGHAALGLSVLAKGPVGPLIVLPILVADGLAGRRLRAWFPRGFFAALPIFLLTGLAWYVAVILTEPGALDHFVRAGTFRNVRHARSPAYYLVQIPVAVAPFTLLLPAALARALRGRGDPERLRLPLFWLSLPVLLFSLSASKQSHYLVPMLPGAAVLLAALLRDALPGRARGAVSWWCSPRVLLAVTGCALALLSGATLFAVPEAGIVLPAAGIAGFGLTAGLAARRRTGSAVGAFLATVFLVEVGFVAAIQPALEAPRSVRGIAERLATLAGEHGGAPLASTEDNEEILWYAGAGAGGRRIVLLKPDAGSIAAFLREHPRGLVLARLQETGDPPPGVEILERAVLGRHGGRESGFIILAARTTDPASPRGPTPRSR